MIEITIERRKQNEKNNCCSIDIGNSFCYGGGQLIRHRVIQLASAL